ncbi:MAG: tRNA 2-thiocytidine(32) synthetase TtcA [Hyphomicrobiales bacterium]
MSIKLDTIEHDNATVSQDSCHPLFLDAPSSVSFKKIRKRLLRQMREAMDDFSMIERGRGSGQKWLVCLSGGKDSYTLLSLLLDLKWRGVLPVELLACNLDQAQPGFPAHILPEFFEKYGIPNRIERKDTYSIVTDKVPEGATYCALCSRLRRGNLYRIAREEGCSAVILGHHRDDILETFLLNFFHGGRLAAMPPKLLNDEGDLMLMRPLSYCGEEDIEKFSNAMEFPIIPCDLCGSQDGLQRNVMKQMLNDIESKMPGRKDVMLRALTNVRPSHLLDQELFDFAGLSLDELAKGEAAE